MKCPKCQTENPETRKFCRKCGAKLLKLCPQCGSENLPDDNFCGKCGHNLSVPPEPSARDLSLDEKLAKIQLYLPKGLTEKILAQRGKIEGERKQVTVIFCDMEGFTALSERLGPEEAYSIMDQVYEILIHKVHDYEGTVNEMTGDGIMALFGAPIALEDAPQRAIRSAYSIHREMARFSDQLKPEKGMPPIKMRIGVHTGPVVVGTLGNDLRVEFKAVGDTVNLASRMEGLAEPGATYVTEETFKLTEGLFRFEALGELEVKGRERAVRTYRVIAPSTRRTRFDVSAERGLTPFVGKERELELLLDGFERSKGGRGQAFSIIAEAGVGKSRFLYEFRKAVANEDATFLEGRCLSYSRGVSYHPVIDILKSNFNIGEDDGDPEIREKVTRGLKALGADEASTLPYLLELLSVKDSGIDKILLSPEARKNRILEALKRIVLKGSEIRPLIMAYEDLHWIDKSSEESLKGLLDAISGARVFLIFTYRPEYVHTWGAKSYHSQVMLNRLSNRESLTMVSHLLGTGELNKDLEQLVLEKTEGVPFFIEELISSLKDQRIIEKKDNRYHLSKDIREVTIPSTIQDVIMARVDSLPEGAKGLLQTASVVGREFSHDLIKRVTDLSEEELWSHLSVLKDSELLYERGIYPQSTYVFKHALTHQVAYGSLLQERRRSLHARIMKAIEWLHASRLTEQVERIAQHALKGEIWDKALVYLRQAGRKNFGRAVPREAAACFEQALVALQHLPQSPDLMEQAIDVRFELRDCLFVLGEHDRIFTYLQEAEVLAQSLNDQPRLGRIAVNMLHSFWDHGQYDRALESGHRALDIAASLQDLELEVWANLRLGYVYQTLGDYQRAVDVLRRNVELLGGELIHEYLNLPFLPSVFSRNWLNWCLVERGDFAEGLARAEEGVRIAEEVGQWWSRIVAYFSVGLAHLRKGDFDKAIPNLECGLGLCQESEIPVWLIWTSATLGHAYALSGRVAEALPLLEHAVEPMISFVPNRSLWMTYLAEAYLLAGRVDDTTRLALRALDFGRDHKELGNQAWALRLIAEIAVHREPPEIEQARNQYSQALALATDLGMRPLQAHCHLGFGKLYRRTGDCPKAQSHLTTATVMFREMDMRFWLEQAEAELKALGARSTKNWT